MATKCQVETSKQECDESMAVKAEMTFKSNCGQLSVLYLSAGSIPELQAWQSLLWAFRSESSGRPVEVNGFCLTKPNFVEQAEDSRMLTPGDQKCSSKERPATRSYRLAVKL